MSEPAAVDAERFLLLVEAYCFYRALYRDHARANRLAHLAAAIWLGERAP